MNRAQRRAKKYQTKIEVGLIKNRFMRNSVRKQYRDIGSAVEVNAENELFGPAVRKVKERV